MSRLEFMQPFDGHQPEVETLEQEIATEHFQRRVQATMLKFSPFVCDLAPNAPRGKGSVLSVELAPRTADILVDAQVSLIYNQNNVDSYIMLTFPYEGKVARSIYSATFGGPLQRYDITDLQAMRLRAEESGTKQGDILKALEKDMRTNGCEVTIDEAQELSDFIDDMIPREML
jgi:hypothetical protein